MNPSELSTEKSKGRDLHLLSIEGRGICGLMALITLKEILCQYQYLQKLPQPPRPCDVFDLTGSMGTGGIIAVMLFRLGMTVDEAIVAYTALSEDVFSKKNVLSHKKTNASRLENAIAKVIQSSLDVDKNQSQNVRMLDAKGPKCFISAVTAKNISSPTLFRTYVPPRHPTYDCTIVEAIRATTAEDPFFPSVDIGDANLKETFIHVGSRINNPVRALLEEAVLIFPGQYVSCVLSIGSGAQGITGIETSSSAELAKALNKALNDGDRISDEVAKELSDRDTLYCRLNVDHGLEAIGFEDWQRLGDVRTHTQKYLEKYDATQKVSRLVQVLNRRTAIASTFEETLMVLSQFLDGLISVSPEDSWSMAISKLIRIVEPGKAATETLNMQCALLRDTLESCMKGRNFAGLPDDLRGNIQQLLKGLKKTFQASPGQEDPIVHVIVNIQKLLQRFWVQNHIAGNIMVHDILKHIQKDDSVKKTFTRLEQHAINQNLGNLNVAPFAAYDSFEVAEKTSCFKGTRVKLLNEIASWIAGDDPSLTPIYVLDGVAGIGKTTIAKTVAEYAAGINILGASFFFSRNDDKRKTAMSFLPTIAYQLAYYDMAFADQINKALLRVPHVVTQMPVKQFSTLIVEPLERSLTVAGNPILIIIDALDECEHDGDVLLKILADSIKKMPRLKIFVTTRPEYHIRHVLDRYQHLKRFHLQDIEKSVVESDIRLYLDFHLSENQVRDKLPHLKCIWKPTKKDRNVLVGMCGTLFIIASTTVKFILDTKRSDPVRQLSRLLKGVSYQDFSGSKHTTVMDLFYTQILLAAVPNHNDDSDSDDEDDWFGHYQIVVGTIVALQYPLPCLALSALLNFDIDDVVRALSHLYSIVAPTGHDLAFRIHHKSFPDFVTSPSRCEPRFLIDLKMRHMHLGKRCLSIMDSLLKPNIRNLDTTDRFKDNDIGVVQHDRTPQELAYASTHWATHLANASKLDDEAERLLEDFACKHLLAWLELLSVIGQVEIAYPSLDRICKLLDGLKRKAGITREIFHDGCRFIALNIDLIKVAAGHVYSAFAFTPQDTKLYATYQGMKGMNLGVVYGYDHKWNPTISVMTGHESQVVFVTFSGDGTRLASASADKTVRVWEGETGAEVSTLRGHSKTVNSVVFSPDGTTLASASADRTVRLWDAQTGVEMGVLRGHSKSVYSVVFSPDGARLASASADNTVRMWDGQSGTAISVLRGHSDEVNYAVFSPNGMTLASVAEDGTVRLWDGMAGANIFVLQGHSNSVYFVVFSPGGTRLASASADKTIRLWDGKTGVTVAVFQGHSDEVDSVVFSPNGTRLASASEDGTVRLWNAQSGAEMGVLRGHSNSVYSVVFSLDGTRLASASADGAVRLWNPETCAEIAVLRGHSDEVNSVVFSPNGTTLASVSEDGTVLLWDAQTSAQMKDLPGRSKSVKSIVFSPDGMTLASASADGTVRLWDGQTGAKIAVCRGHSDWVNSVVFSPNGTRLASVSEDGTVRLWDGQTGAEMGVLRGHSNSVYSVVFSPDGTRIASASADGTVRLWDGQSGDKILVLRGHLDEVDWVAFSPDGTRLASASEDRTVRLWNARTGAEMAVLRGHSNSVYSVVFSPDGMTLASASADGKVLLWDGQTGAKVAILQGHSDEVNLVVFSLDGMRLASASEDGTARLWDAQTFSEITVLRGQSDEVNLVLFSPDGTRLASTSCDGMVRLWDGQTGAEIFILRGHTDEVNTVVFSPDGTRLGSSSEDGMIRLWNAQTGAEIAVLRGHSLGVKSVAFSRDGMKLASASEDGAVRLWDSQTTTEIAVLRGHTDWVYTVMFSPDDTILASASEDGTVRLWDGQTGTEIAVLGGHSLWVNAVVFSPDSTRLASASDDRTVQLWNAQTGAKTAVLQGHSDEVSSVVVFSPDGRRLASASDDGLVRLWDTQSDAVIFDLRGHSNSVRLVVFSPDGTTLASASEDGTVRLWDAQTGAQNASYPGFIFADFTLDGSKLLLVDTEEVYHVHCITGDKVAVPLGMFINLGAGERVPGLDLWVVSVNRKRPSLLGLLVVKVGHNGDLCFMSLCWFPPNLPVISFAVSSLSQVAIGCNNGQVLLLDIDFPSLL